MAVTNASAATPHSSRASIAMLICRRRRSHVKCTEQIPCQRCVRLARHCSYEQETKRPRRMPGVHQFRLNFVHLPSRFALPAFSGSEKDLETFQYFLEETSPILDRNFATHRWIDALLACQANNSTTHRACLAVGSLHRSLSDQRTDVGLSTPLTGLSASAESYAYYTQALRSTRRGIQDGSLPPAAVKFACIMLALASSLLNHSEEVKSHLLGGLQLAAAQYASPSDKGSVVDGILSGNRFTSLIATRSIDFTSLPANQFQLDDPQSSGSNSIRDARGSLHALMRATVLLVDSEQNGWLYPAFEREMVRVSIDRALERWRQSTDTMRQCLGSDDEAGLALLDAQYEFARCKLDGLDTPYMLSSDVSLERLKSMVASLHKFVHLYMQSGKPSMRVFSYQTGVIPLLLYVANLTQDRDLHQRIITVLRQSPTVEGVWRADAAIAAVQQRWQQQTREVIVDEMVDS